MACRNLSKCTLWKRKITTNENKHLGCSNLFPFTCAFLYDFVFNSNSTCCKTGQTTVTLTLLTRPTIGFEHGVHTPCGCTITPCSARFSSSASRSTDRLLAFCFNAGEDIGNIDTLSVSIETSAGGRLVTILVGKRFSSSVKWTGILNIHKHHFNGSFQVNPGIIHSILTGQAKTPHKHGTLGCTSLNSINCYPKWFWGKSFYRLGALLVAQLTVSKH